MKDLIIIPNNLQGNAPQFLAEEFRKISLTTQNWRANGGRSLFPLSPPLQTPQHKCEQPLF